MEFIAFCVLSFLGLLTLILESNSVLKYIYIPSTFIFLIIVRLQAFYFNGFEIDIITYTTEMQSSLVLESFYYIREFIFWFTIRLVYWLTESPFFTFIILDFLWIILLIKSTEKIKSNNLGHGVLVVLMTSFPFLFGYENIYRQFIATIVLLYAYSCIKYNYFKSILLFLISVFTHNLMMFVLPVFVIKKFYKFNIKDRSVISFLISISYILLLPFFLNLKSFDTTQVDLSLLYLVLFLSLMIFFMFKFKQNILKLIENLPSLFPSCIIILGLSIIGHEMITERISMILIIFLIYDLYLYTSKITKKSTRLSLRLALLFLFTLPVFLFESSLKFLF